MKIKPTLVFCTIALVFFSVSGVAGVFLNSEHSRLRSGSYDQSGLAGVQILTHYENLLALLVRFESGLDLQPHQDIQTKFDILYERLRALPDRPPYDVILNPVTLHLYKDSLAVMTGLLPTVERVGHGDRSAAHDIRTAMERLRPELEKATSNLIHLATDFREANGRRIQGLTMLLIAAVMLMAFAGVATSCAIFIQYRNTNRRTEELRRTHEELEIVREQERQANAVESNFLANMSHELRTPLNAIIGFSEIMRADIGTKSRYPKYAEYLDNIYRSGFRLLDLISEILDFSASNQIAPVLDVRKTGIGDLVGQSVERVRDIAVRYGVTVEQRIEPDLGSIACDVDQLSLALGKLLSNAIVHSEDGERVVLEAGTSADGLVQFVVSGNGACVRGAGAECLNSTPERDPQIVCPNGAGLVYPFINRIITAHGGTLSYGARHTGGSMVAATLPDSLPAAQPLGQIYLPDHVSSESTVQ